jgi:hypothetical protein
MKKNFLISLRSIRSKKKNFLKKSYKVKKNIFYLLVVISFILLGYIVFLLLCHIDSINTINNINTLAFKDKISDLESRLILLDKQYLINIINFEYYKNVYSSISMNYTTILIFWLYKITLILSKIPG